MIEKADLQGVRIFPVDLDQAVEVVAGSIPQKNGDYFCFSNIHVVMESHRNPELKSILNNATANFPDGMGVALALKFLGNTFEGRVRGADFMLKLCSHASKNNLKIFFYGNSEETLSVLKEKLLGLFPGIKIAGSISPPFRELTKDEDQAFVEKINAAGPDMLFISLGAPKQERWMSEHKGRIKAVQLGVGAAFSFITGKVKPAPKWMQKTALEWLYRLPQEPKKTIYRMSLVPGFIFRILLQLIKRW
ncbi:MAG: WecB/TagA/CpsF family glycosyltransferase [Nitrospira sp.]|nr:WecB/TagA/CpsF family glycosyltransferase [Nitrospira sp.]